VVVVGECLLVLGGEGTADEVCLAAKDGLCLRLAPSVRLWYRRQRESSLYVARRYG